MTSNAPQKGIDARPSANSSQAASILLVDDDRTVIQLMGKILAGIGDVRFAANGKDALRLAHDSIPDIILLDAEMPGMSGFDLLKTLKSDPVLVNVPVIFITSHAEAEFEVCALQMGAADFISKPFRSAPALARLKTHLRIKQLTDDLRRAANTDVLTGVANRRLFDELLEREWLRGRRTGDPLSLLLIDVDHFKLFNDRYGHPKGDVCLRAVAMALLSTCHRPADLVARYGGEEFVVLLPQTPREGAEQIAANILAAVNALNIAHEDSLTAPRVSVSVGVGYHAAGAGSKDSRESRSMESGPEPVAATDLILAADKALYAAKSAGRAQAKTRDIHDKT